MDDSIEIRGIATIRRIRDEQTHRMQGKTDEEIIEFFRRMAEQAREDTAYRTVHPPATI